MPRSASQPSHAAAAGSGWLTIDSARRRPSVPLARVDGAFQGLAAEPCRQPARRTDDATCRLRDATATLSVTTTDHGHGHLRGRATPTPAARATPAGATTRSHARAGSSARREGEPGGRRRRPPERGGRSNGCAWSRWTLERRGRRRRHVAADSLSRGVWQSQPWRPCPALERDGGWFGSDDGEPGEGQ